MTDEPLTQADLFLEHAIRDESLAAQLLNADFATVVRVALGLGYQFTEEEFAEALEEYKDDQLDNAQLEQITGGVDVGDLDEDEEEETDIAEGKLNVGTALQNTNS